MTDNNKTNNDERLSNLSRRHFITKASASLAVLSFPVRTTFGAQSTKGSPKIVWVILRGALDSLHTIIPIDSPEYKMLRPKLSTSFRSPLLPLNSEFYLHPSLKNLHEWYQNKALLPIVAVSSGYSQRSHFDGQDFLESGKSNIDHDSGWLARAIEIKNKRALAISHSIPISLRSSSNVYSWYPSKFKESDNDFYEALHKLYEYDEPLKTTLENGLKIKEMIGVSTNNKKGKFVDLNSACANLMTGKQGVDCAMIELGGWDTHSNQSKRLDRKLTELDNGLATLKAGLGKEWENTIVIVGTEFGRTAKENGTGGTDHGTASALFLAGGAINGGQIKGHWPGLKDDELLEQRDLMPTSNSFSWIANVLSGHWGFNKQELKQVFPHVNPYNEIIVRR